MSNDQGGRADSAAAARDEMGTENTTTAIVRRPAAGTGGEIVLPDATPAEAPWRPWSAPWPTTAERSDAEELAAWCQLAMSGIEACQRAPHYEWVFRLLDYSACFPALATRIGFPAPLTVEREESDCYIGFKVCVFDPVTGRTGWTSMGALFYPGSKGDTIITGGEPADQFAARAVHYLRRCVCCCKVLAARRGADQRRGEAPTTTGPTTTDAQVQTSKKALALSLLVENPGLSHTAIAERVGCGRTTLYKWREFKTARAAMKAARGSMPRGSEGQTTVDTEA